MRPSFRAFAASSLVEIMFCLRTDSSYGVRFVEERFPEARCNPGVTTVRALYSHPTFDPCRLHFGYAVSSSCRLPSESFFGSFFGYPFPTLLTFLDLCSLIVCLKFSSSCLNHLCSTPWGNMLSPLGSYLAWDIPARRRSSLEPCYRR